MSEETFWRTMNPSRLHALYDAKFRSGVRSGHRQSQAAQAALGPGMARYVDLSPRDDEDDGTRLAAYFAGGD